MPDYPLAPEHTWRDSFDPMTDLAERWARSPAGLLLYGDSAGGGYALALAVALRDRGGAQPTHLLLHSPWVDLTHEHARDRGGRGRSTRGCSSASSTRTPSGGPAPRRTSTGPR